METPVSVLNQIQKIFQDVFDDDELIVTPETTAADVEEWDSLMHVTLILEIESHFNVRFSSGEVAGLKSVGDLCALVERSQS
jgi:acyl carrier protein